MANTFKPHQDFAIGNVTYSVITVDVNGDGKLDLIATDYGSNAVSVLLGNGNGTFAAKQDFTTGSTPVAVTAADVNRDGKLDLIVADQNGNAVSVLLGNGNGTFAANTDYLTGGVPISVAVADVNGDGKLDLIAAAYGSNAVSVLLGNGNGTFAARTDYTTGNGPQFVTVADVNGDGKLDLIAADYSSNTVSVLLGNGNGTFAAKTDYATGSGPLSIAVGDVNGDGKLDLIVADVTGNTVSVLLGNGNGTFAAKTDYAAGAYPSSVTVADVNGDGKLDLVVTDESDNAASVLLGNGNGTFAAKQSFATGSTPYTAAVADVNRDGKLDLVTADVNSAAVSVLLGATTDPVTTVTASAASGSAVKAGATITFTLATETPVTVTGTPALTLNNGATASYTGQDATSHPIFSYTVASGQDTTDLKVTGLSLNGGTITAPGQTSFATHHDYTTGSGPTSVTLVDVNRDGKLDLITADFGGGSGNAVSVLLGNGDGTFGAKQDLTVGTGPRAVATADVNGDGKLDLLVTNELSNTVSVLLGNGDGTFGTKQDFTAGRYPFAVTAADVNGDGKLDLLVANDGDGTVSVLLGSGNGSFGGKQDLSTGLYSNPVSVIAADVNGDGKLDLLAADSGNNDVAVLLGNGNGTFGAATAFATGVNPFLMTTADVNGDGKLDLITANYGNGSGNTVSVLLGNGNGTFAGKQDYTVGSTPTSVAAVDVNGDGKLDLVVGNGGSSTVSVLLGNGDGTFAAKQDFTAGSGAWSVASGDVNGDGKTDLLVTNIYGNSVSVLLNTSTKPATFDASGLTSLSGADTHVTIDTVAPTVQSITPSNAGPTNASTLTESVTFSESVTGVVTSDFRVTTVTGSASAHVSLVSGNGTTYTVTLDQVSGGGTFRLDLNAGTPVADAAGNNAPGYTGGGTTDIDRPGTLALAGLTNGNAQEGTAIVATISDPDGAAIGTPTYTFSAGGNQLQSGTSNSYTPGYTESGEQITVSASYTDGQNHADMASASAGIVQDVDRPGTLTLSGLSAGNAREGMAITATLSDADGTGTGTPTYTFSAGSNQLQSGSSNSYTPGYGEADEQITVTASYTDGQSHAATASASAGTVQDVDQAGTLTLSGLMNGNAREGTAITATISDPDGAATGATYTFSAGGNQLQSGSSNSYTPGFSESGEQITVTASYTDGQSHADTASASAGTVLDIDRAGTLALSGLTNGNAQEGMAITATISDPDGAATGAIYTFAAGSTQLQSGSANSYTPGYGAAGQQITVSATYTDGQSHSDTASASAGTVQDFDRAGTLTLSGLTGGNAQEGTAIVATLMDPDGNPGSGTYTFTDTTHGNAVLQTGSSNSYTPSYAESGEQITVATSYTDGQSHADTASAAAGTVQDVDQAGTLTLSGLTGGNAREGTAITAAITDPDGSTTGTPTYTFSAGGNQLQTGSSNSYAPGYSESGEQITVTASYTDGQSHPDTASTTAGTVQDVDRPGLLTVSGLSSGNAREGTAITATISDPDGAATGTPTYTFTTGSNQLQSGSSNSYTPGYSESGEQITVTATYTDGQSHSDTASATAGTVQDVDRAGTLTLSGLTSGNAREGTAITAAISDPDGAAAGAIYTFSAGGNQLQSGSSNSYTPGYGESGEQITVSASYTDGQNHADTASMSAGTVQDVDRIGTLNLAGLTSGNAREGTAITATISDPDGAATGAIYTFSAGGNQLQTGSSNSYTPGYSESGEQITVTASYTDGQSHADSASASAGTVQDVDRAGTLTFSGLTGGNAREGSTITATISDPDGAATGATYTFSAGGSQLQTGSLNSYTPGYSESGEQITVTASYTDGQSHADTASASAGTVQDVDRAGTLALSGLDGSGNAHQGTAIVAAITDPDGNPSSAVYTFTDTAHGNTVLYQGASNSFTPGTGTAGDAITVSASYTDVQGHADMSQASAGTVVSAASVQNQSQFGAVTHDPHSTGGEVFEFYDAFQGRAPDPVGLENLNNDLLSGMSLHDLAASMLSSAEHTQKFGDFTRLSDADYVEQLYEVVQHRVGEADGLSHWETALANGMSRVDVGIAFALSDEHMNRLQSSFSNGIFVPDKGASDIARLYYGIQDRAPDGPGLAHFVTDLANGRSVHDIVGDFLRSPEYQGKFGGLDDTHFVDALYQGALGRHAEPEGLSHFVSELQRGGSRTDVAFEIAESNEAHDHLTPVIEAGWHLS